jgi:hypothetical protein
MIEEGCPHRFEFRGAVQVYEGDRLSGVVDVFSCALCGSTDQVVKRPGESARHTLGFDPSPPGQVTCILTCAKGGRADWQLCAVSPGSEMVHNCSPLGGEVKLQVTQDLKVPSFGGVEHALYSLKENVNQAIRLP